jgi:hypothetical protein
LVTLLWEALIKPMKVARSLGEVLGIEVGNNGQGLLIDRTQRREDPTSAPVRTPMDTEVYQVVLPQLGEIPRPLLGQIVHLYGLFDLVNELALRSNELRDRMIYALSDNDISPGVRVEYDRTLGMYMSATDAAVDMVVEVQNKLIALAFPWWSTRHWFGPRPRRITEGQMAAKYKAGKREVEGLIAHVRREGARRN